MADTIQIKRGVKSEIPTLLLGELGYCTDTQELYVGTGSSNKLVGKVAWGEDIANIATTTTDHESRIATLEAQVAGLLNTEEGG